MIVCYTVSRGNEIPNLNTTIDEKDSKSIDKEDIVSQQNELRLSMNSVSKFLQNIFKQSETEYLGIHWNTRTI